MKASITNSGATRLVWIVCQTLGVSYDIVMEGCQIADCLKVRQIASTILKEEYTISTTRIGGVLNKNHATVINAIRRCRSYVKTEPSYALEYRACYDACMKELKSEVYANDTESKTPAVDAGAQSAGRAQSRLQLYVSVCQMAQAAKRKASRRSFMPVC